MIECTWKGCKNEAAHTLKDRNGDEWAHLCDAHYNEFNSVSFADEDFSAKRALKVWVLAQGGAEGAASRMSLGHLGVIQGVLRGFEKGTGPEANG